VIHRFRLRTLQEWRRGLAVRLDAISESPRRVALGFALGTGVACTPMIGLHFILAVGAALATRSSVPAAVVGSFAANPWTYPLTLAGGYAIGSRLIGTDAAYGGGNPGGLLTLVRAVGAGDWSTLAAVGPILGATALGGTILGIAVGTLAYVAARATLRRMGAQPS